MLAFEVFPFESLAKPAKAETTNLSEALPVLVALKVTLRALNSGSVAVQPRDTTSRAMSFCSTVSLKVRDTFTLLAMFTSLVKELDVIEGFMVLIETDRAGEADEVSEPRFCLAVIDQVPSDSVPKVQLAVPSTPATPVVQVTLLEEGSVAVTITVAPWVRPVKSKVGVLSEVLLSVALEPVSEFMFRSGAVGVANWML